MTRRTHSVGVEQVEGLLDLLLLLLGELVSGLSGGFERRFFLLEGRHRFQILTVYCFELDGWFIGDSRIAWVGGNRSYTVSLLLFVVAVVDQVVIVVVVEVEHVVGLLAVPVVVHQWLGNVGLVNAGLEGVQVALRVWDVVEVDDLAVWLGMPDLDADPAPRCLC